MVVPAKAGTHTAESLRSDAWLSSLCNDDVLGLWVPAFAGTTQVVDPSVVPAKAGTHTAESLRGDAWLSSLCNDDVLGLWVPAFAGTTEIFPRSFRARSLLSDMRLHSRGAFRARVMRHRWPSKAEGAGKTGRWLRPQPRVEMRRTTRA